MLTDDEVGSALTRSGDKVHPGPVPMTWIVRNGREAQGRRRRNRFVGLVAVAGLVVAGVVLARGLQASDGGVAGSDSRGLGLNGVSVSVPTTWAVDEDSCSQQAEGIVMFEADFAPICPDATRDFIYSVTVTIAADLENAFGLELPSANKSVVVDGMETTESIVDCVRGSCAQVFGVPAKDVWFVVTAPESRRGELQVVRDSLAPIPAGQVAVPYIHRNSSPQMATSKLESTGLSPQPTTGDTAAAKVLGTDPPAGSVVDEGSRIKLVFGGSM